LEAVASDSRALTGPDVQTSGIWKLPTSCLQLGASGEDAPLKQPRDAGPTAAVFWITNIE